MKKMNVKALTLVCCLLFAAILSGCSSAAPSQGAASQSAAQTESEPAATAAPEQTAAEKALAAYQEILKAAPALEGEHEELADASFDYEQNLAMFGNHYDLFALCDLNQDEIPELIALSIVNFRWTQAFVYTYANGEAVLLKDPAAPEAPCTFDQMSTADGAYFMYLCAENHLHNVWRGSTPVGEMEENYAYTLDGTTLAAADCTAGETEAAVYFYDVAAQNTAANVDAMLW